MNLDDWSEADLYAACISAAKRGRWWWWHDNDSRRNKAGLPDLILIHRFTGRLLFRELKTAKGKLRAEQEECLALLGKQCDAGVWRPEDWASGLIQSTLLREGRAAA